jgi:putative copper export protein
MLTVTADTVRLFLHVLAATIWVGGQLTLAALVPVLRQVSPTAPRAAARRFNAVAWPAYVVLVGTGVWNVTAAPTRLTGAHLTTLIVKLVVVAASGVAALLHARARTAIGLAAWGAITGASALSALFLGVLLAG